MFLGTTAGAVAGAWRGAYGQHAWAGSPADYRDPQSSVMVQVLTPEAGTTSRTIYQTHPMWTPRMDYVVFYSDMSGGWAPHARQMGSGMVRPLAEGDVGLCALARENDALYFLKDNAVHRQHVRAAFQNLRRAEVLTELPRRLALSGGISLDAEEKVLYAGLAESEEGPWHIQALDLDSRRWTNVLTVDFQVGHVQAHPASPGLIMFCHETGGDAPQRMWTTRVESGVALPFYEETFDEWVTHEVWWTDKRVLFTVWPYDDQREAQMHGIVSMNLQKGDLRNHARYRAWHTHGSPDGKWILGDDFDRNLWLIEPMSGERRLLTGGHNGEGFTTHPHAAFSPDGSAIVFNSGRLGYEAVFLVQIPRFDTLPAAPE